MSVRRKRDQSPGRKEHRTREMLILYDNVNNALYGKKSKEKRIRMHKRRKEDMKRKEEASSKLLWQRNKKPKEWKTSHTSHTMTARI